MSIVYIDTETTGLDPSIHEVWEIAYAVGDGPIHFGTVPHLGASADPSALAMNGYWERGFTNFKNHLIDGEVRDALEGATLVGANPAFDAAFLRQRWGVAPWKYRLLDIEAYAMAALGLDEPKGLSYIAEQLQVQAPDHTAAGDVRTLRECHEALRRLYEAMPPFRTRGPE